MKKPGSRRKIKKWKAVVVVLLLAAVCIGGVELAVCRVMDPVLFDRITAPVRIGARRLADGVEGAASAVQEMVQETVRQALLSLERPPEEVVITVVEEEEPPLSQYATDPALWTDLTEQAQIFTRLEVREEGEVLTGGTSEIIYYNQSDEAWSSLPYGSDTIGRFGCGPVAMTMAVSALAGVNLDPAQMAEWAKENGYWARGSGSYLSIVPGTARAFGLACNSMEEPDPERLRQELAGGNMAVALMGKGHFTQRGHFILLRGITLDGKILVSDPNSRELSLALWDAELILAELSSSRSHGGPLWILSRPTAEEQD